MKYPATFTQDESGAYTVTFRDIPEAITCGDDLEDARAMAADALLTAMDFYFEDKRAVPKPSKMQAGEEWVFLPASAAAKILLLNEMVKQKVSASELARRLNTRPQDVNRIVNLHHSTKIDTIDLALQKMGKSLELRA